MFHEVASTDAKENRRKELAELKTKWKDEFITNVLDIASIQEYYSVFYEDGDETDSSEDYEDDSEYDSEDDSDYESGDESDSESSEEDVLETFDFVRFFTATVRELETENVESSMIPIE